MYDIEKNITDAMEILIDSKLSGLQYNSYIRAVITSIQGSICTVQYNSQTLTGVNIKDGVNPVIGSIVYVCVPNHIMSDAFVDCIVPTGKFNVMNVGNIFVLAGDSKLLITSIVDGNNNPVNLSTLTVKWVLMDSTNTVLLTKTVGTGITITDSVNGKCNILINSTDTLSLLGTYNHKASVVDTNNNSSTVFTGTMTIGK